MQGRFTSPDEFREDATELFTVAERARDNPIFYAELSVPQSFNKYHYCKNNPLRFIDPSGKEVLFVYVGAAFPNPYGHAAIKHVNEKTGEVTYYDAAYDKDGAKKIVINKYTEEEFKKRYGERGIEAVHVDVPNEEGSLKYIAGVVNKEWDYNAVTNNCVSFATYVIEMGGGQAVSDGSRFENPKRYPRDGRDGYKKRNEEKQKTRKNNELFWLRD